MCGAKKNQNRDFKTKQLVCYIFKNMQITVGEQPFDSNFSCFSISSHCKFVLVFPQAQMTSASCPVNSPAMAPGSQGSHIHCPTLPQPPMHRNSPSPVPSRTPTPHHTPPGLGSQQQQAAAATATAAPTPTPQAMPPGPQSQTMHPPQRQTPTPPQAQLPPQVQPPVPITPSAEQQQQPLSQQSTTASVPTPTAPLQPQHPTTPVRKYFNCAFPPNV